MMGHKGRCFPWGSIPRDILAELSSVKGRQLCFPVLASLPSLWVACLLRTPKGLCRFSGPSAGMLNLQQLLGAPHAGAAMPHEATSHTPTSPSPPASIQTSGWNSECLSHSGGK